MFSTLLIANRGEIACRIIRTARRLGVRTVAVFSDADRRALHVEMADEALHIGSSPAAESYLRGDRIIEAALKTGAEAIHPGYGFLSENPDFAEAVAVAGLVFVGPTPAAIRAMGLKDAAKRLMEKAGVPVVPGYHGEGQGLVLLAGKAEAIGYPVLIKARAGGGGKGMRRVERPEEFSEALAAAKREANAAFGDDAVLLERYVEQPRHIEVQVFGDRHGNVVHLFERDCSLQRRHQKVIEEAPASGISAEMREAVTAAAVKATGAIGYIGAGTVEFIADASEGLRPDRFFFMEMNTRLQVEHPVTEMVTGVDLVEWQLRVAAGESLPLKQEEIRLSGHSVEARLYAENPARNFLPAPGTLRHLRFPPPSAALRVETGVRSGDEVSPFYDPMVAKLVAYGPDRSAALEALAEALKETEVAGTATNRAFLVSLLRDEEIRAGHVDTGLIARKPELAHAPAPSPEAITVALAAASGAAPARDGRDPWDLLAGYAHHHPLKRAVELRQGGAASMAYIHALAPDRFRVEREGEPSAIVSFPAAEAAPTRPELRVGRAEAGGQAFRFVAWAGGVAVFDERGAAEFSIPAGEENANRAAAGGLTAPMPGLVKLVRAAKGDAVRRGDPLLVLEAMKMEHTIAAPHDGAVSEIVAAGRQVSEGEVLARLTAEE
ncbi:MAG TPA: biotin carboxylase N-terminal domain-containing protein [Mesorhizobium sp.]|jgi:3-methylcrotonyl-CoA carboxylase alpha subunit|nr:biotin carboxylase N-terminal domain-containing protein [Mesorhizobium sp.]